jgi:hypothetical protein
MKPGFSVQRYLCPLSFIDVPKRACFLSATPVHNKNQVLFALLNLLDPETFHRLDDFQYILQANAPPSKSTTP